MLTPPRSSTPQRWPHMWINQTLGENLHGKGQCTATRCSRRHTGTHRTWRLASCRTLGLTSPRTSRLNCARSRATRADCARCPTPALSPRSARSQCGAARSRASRRRRPNPASHILGTYGLVRDRFAQQSGIKKAGKLEQSPIRPSLRCDTRKSGGPEAASLFSAARGAQRA